MTIIFGLLAFWTVSGQILVNFKGFCAEEVLVFPLSLSALSSKLVNSVFRIKKVDSV